MSERVWKRSRPRSGPRTQLHCLPPSFFCLIILDRANGEYARGSCEGAERLDRWRRLVAAFSFRNSVKSSLLSSNQNQMVSLVQPQFRCGDVCMAGSLAPGLSFDMQCLKMFIFMVAGSRSHQDGEEGLASYHREILWSPYAGLRYQQAHLCRGGYHPVQATEKQDRWIHHGELGAIRDLNQPIHTIRSVSNPGPPSHAAFDEAHQEGPRPRHFP